MKYSSQEDHQISGMFDKQWAFEIPQEIDNLSDSEKMKLIRSRKRQNQEKVRKFFGSDLKIDVSLNMIKAYKLPAMMESDLPLTYFISFLIKYQGVENLVSTDYKHVLLLMVSVFSSSCWKLKSSRKPNSTDWNRKRHSPKEFSTLSWKIIFLCKLTQKRS